MGHLKIALIYDPKDNKIAKESYSQTYRGQFLALKNLPSVIDITESCSAKDIDADVIMFYDVHSSHHIEIEGIANHPALKYEYFNDPHQLGVKGKYLDTGRRVHKLNTKERTQRALDRGVDFIICPFTEPYYHHIAPHLKGRADEMFVWFPPSPDIGLFHKRCVPLKDRIPKILGNGTTTLTKRERGYITRKWAHQQPYILFVPYCLDLGAKIRARRGEEYPDFLSHFAASIAITDDHIVPKYLEIPLAGCVCFASEHQDYKNMGFRDGENCYFVNKSNLKGKAEYFLANIEEHQKMADAGRKLIEENWTARHFAKFIYNHAEKQLSK